MALWSSADLTYSITTKCEDDMATPNPLVPVKGSGPRSGFTPVRAMLMQTRCQMRVDSPGKNKGSDPRRDDGRIYDDNYLDDEDADWVSTGQGQNLQVTPVLRWPGSPARKGSGFDCLV